MDHGFPLASLVSHLRAFLYEHILESQVQFYSSVVVSGEHHGTGEYKWRFQNLFTSKLFGMVSGVFHITRICFPIELGTWRGKMETRVVK